MNTRVYILIYEGMHYHDIIGVYATRELAEDSKFLNMTLHGKKNYLIVEAPITYEVPEKLVVNV